MSYLTFHTRTEDIRLTGVEVQHISAQAIEVLTGILANDYGPVRRALGVAGSGAPLTHLRYLIGAGIVGIPTGLPQRPTLPVDLFNLALDSWVVRHPEARPLAWLYHGCGRHVWVAGPDRILFADRLQVALDMGLARPGMADPAGGIRIGDLVLPGGDRVGWEEIITWLRAGSDPVVTSVSVADPWPNRYLPVDAGVWHPNPIEDDDQGDDDPWDRLDHTTQWDLCWQALRKIQPSRQWRPDDETWWSPYTLDRLDAALRQAEQLTLTA